METTNAGSSCPISTDNLPHGVEVPIPTSPLRLARVEMVSVGMPAVEVPKLSARFTAFWRMTHGVLLPNTILPPASIVVVDVPPKYAAFADTCVVDALPLKICRPE